MLAVGAGLVAAAACGNDASSPEVPDAGDGSDATAPIIMCGDTLAHYCAASGSSCVLSTMPPPSAGCGGVPGQCSFQDVTLFARPDPAHPDQTDYFDLQTGALVAIITNADGSCVAGPLGFRRSTCVPYVISGSGGGELCCPGDATTFTPSWKQPTAFNQGKCTDAQISAFVDCLSGIPDAATCKTFGADPANKTCIQCAATPSTAAAYGPLVEGSVTIEVNVAGCVANVTGDISATGCGAKVLGLSQCEQAACEANCPVASTDDGTAFQALLACQTKSATTGCKTYADDAACADALEADGGVASICVQGAATFADNAIPMVKLFCGSIVDDAGAADAADGG
jgi:hypothetical protein